MMRSSGPISLVLLFGCVFLASNCALISSPFDNFRIECPQNAGAQRLSVRMVESQGMKRQDAMFSISCNDVNELYPWNGIPIEVAELERENCRYSDSFDPIMDRKSNLSCGSREYVASVVRLFGTKIQIGCCKLRTRDETNCVEQTFGKPFGVNVRTEIENRAMLINAIAVDGHFFRVRFCDLTPRAVGLIEEDAKVEADRKTTTVPVTSTTAVPSTSVPTQSRVIELTTEAQELETSSAFTSPKKIIKIKQPNAKQRRLPESAQTDSNAETNSSWTKGLAAMRETIQTSTVITQDDEQLVQEPLRSLHGTPTVINTAGEESRLQSAGLEALNSSAVESETTTINSADETTLMTGTSTSSTSELSAIDVEEMNQTSTTTIDSIISTQRLTSTGRTSSAEESKSAALADKSANTSIATSQTSTPSTTGLSAISITTEISTSSSVASSDSAISSRTFYATTGIERKIPTKTDFIVTDVKSTETMFPATATDDHEGQTAEEKEVKKIKNSIDQLLKSQTMMEELKKEVEHHGHLTAEQSKVVDQLLSTPIEQEVSGKSIKLEGKEKTENSSNSTTLKNLYEPKDKEHGDVGNDTNQPLNELTTVNYQQSANTSTNDEAKIEKSKSKGAAGEPIGNEKEESASNLKAKQKAAQTKVDEFANEAPFDFDAFPSPPPESPPLATPASSATTQSQQQQTTASVPVITSHEVDYLVADDLSEIPAALRPYARRKFQPLRRGSIRRRPTSVSPYVDEETKNSPFDFGGDGLSQKTFDGREVNGQSPFESGRQPDDSEQPASRFSLPETRFNQRSPFDPPGEIRRAPKPHLNEPFNYNVIDKLPTRGHNYVFIVSNNMNSEPSVDIVFEMPFVETPLTTTLPEISRRDGERSYTPPDNRPMAILVSSSDIGEPKGRTKTELPTNEEKVEYAQSQDRQPLPVVEHTNQLVPMNENPTFTTPEKPALTITSSETTATLESLTKSTMTNESTLSEGRTSETFLAQDEATTPTPLYDPIRFYHTVPPRRGVLKEKVLTFCTKDSAIRDQNNMVIACGSENDVWTPNRCPPATDCFVSRDSLYRICCPVGAR